MTTERKEKKKLVNDAEPLKWGYERIPNRSPNNGEEAGIHPIPYNYYSSL